MARSDSPGALNIRAKRGGVWHGVLSGGLVALLAFTLLGQILDISFIRWLTTWLTDLVLPKVPNVPSGLSHDSAKLAKYVHENSIFIRDVAGKLFVPFIISLLIFGENFFHTRRQIGEAIADQFENISETIEAKVNSAEVLDGLNEIRNRLDDPAITQSVPVGIFDKLLIYSPLFVGEGAGYFREERLVVSFSTVGDDKQVAEAVREGIYPFGACDPFVCIPESADTNDRLDDLLILFPLAKRFGFTLFGRTNIVDKLRTGASIMIGAYEKGSTSYLAAVAFRKWLVENLERAEGFGHRNRRTLEGRIVIHEVTVASNLFDSEESLARSLDKWDFAVLWEPQTSWVLNSQSAILTQFGVVALPTGSEAPFINVLRERPTGPGGLLGEGNWKAWTPRWVLKSDAAQRCLVSAVVTLRSTVERRPVLCRRMYRALARSSVHLHGVDWAADPTSKASILGSVHKHLNHADGIGADVLEGMIRGVPEMLQKSGKGVENRSGIFPFVPSFEYKPSDYSEHLRACHQLWYEYGEAPHKPWSVGDYVRCFVNIDGLKNGTHDG